MRSHAWEYNWKSIMHARLTFYASICLFSVISTKCPRQTTPAQTSSLSHTHTRTYSPADVPLTYNTSAISNQAWLMAAVDRSPPGGWLVAAHVLDPLLFVMHISWTMLCLRIFVYVLTHVYYTLLFYT